MSESKALGGISMAEFSFVNSDDDDNCGDASGDNDDDIKDRATEPWHQRAKKLNAERFENLENPGPRTLEVLDELELKVVWSVGKKFGCKWQTSLAESEYHEMQSRRCVYVTNTSVDTVSKCAFDDNCPYSGKAHFGSKDELWEVVRVCAHECFSDRTIEERKRTASTCAYSDQQLVYPVLKLTTFDWNLAPKLIFGVLKEFVRRPLSRSRVTRIKQAAILKHFGNPDTEVWNLPALCEALRALGHYAHINTVDCDTMLELLVQARKSQDTYDRQKKKDKVSDFNRTIVVQEILAEHEILANPQAVFVIAVSWAPASMVQGLKNFIPVGQADACFAKNRNGCTIISTYTNSANRNPALVMQTFLRIGESKEAWDTHHHAIIECYKDGFDNAEWHQVMDGGKVQPFTCHEIRLHVCLSL